MGKPGTSASSPLMKTPSGSRKRGLGLKDPELPSANLTDAENEIATPLKKRQKSSPTKGKAAVPEEKRLRRFRAKPPQALQVVQDRALQQRFYVLKRERLGTDECPEERLEIAGSTGNVYEVHICKLPTCNCPHAKAGHQCKHVLYVLARVLNAPSDLVYQLALLSSELRTIFQGAPPILSPGEIESRTRRPLEGDCPICFSELDAKNPESVVWCQAVCGQNMHKECFAVWERTKAGRVTCPMCRSPWQKTAGDSATVTKSGPSSDGYVNVADQLGMSRVRDTSTYHRPPNSITPWYITLQRRRGFRGRRRW
ncbi:hypothetical protein B0I35DRAFT_480165 [Stachybotrys elegans]|uniref:Anaphase-promoting complex subunit 11 n=1 Tax=Stachybotrys elegans TaxID=80388 RepID=A0A8K0SNJ2_9HYPO|nr:hypothetical protein B0I35DRAFT_480165 [Stachybotrys elegans]